MSIITKVQLYYDIVSPHSWILFERFASIEPHLPSVKFQFLPVHVVNIHTITGNLVPFYAPPLKKKYFEDIRFLAELHKIPLKTPTDLIDELLLQTASTLRPLLFLLWLADSREPSVFMEASRTMWWRLWVENVTVHTDEDLEAMLQVLNLNQTIGSKMSISEFEGEFDRLGVLLEKYQNDALAFGSFGVPWTVLHRSSDSNSDRNKASGLSGEHFNAVRTSETSSPNVAVDSFSQSFFGCDRWPFIKEVISKSLNTEDLNRLETCEAFTRFGFTM